MNRSILHTVLGFGLLSVSIAIVAVGPAADAGSTRFHLAKSSEALGCPDQALETTVEHSDPAAEASPLDRVDTLSRLGLAPRVIDL
jgi:hypothetical protein